MPAWANLVLQLTDAVTELSDISSRKGDAQSFTANTVIELDRAVQICTTAVVYLKHSAELLANTTSQETFKNNLWGDLLALHDQRNLVRPPLRYSTGNGQPDGVMLEKPMNKPTEG